jgi:uncharacterized protein (TIGR03000 family)
MISAAPAGSTAAITGCSPRARVWLEGKETSQSGADRMFVSPSLEPGYEYVYHIRVQWNQNGKTVEHNREVTVHAGDFISLNIAKIPERHMVSRPTRGGSAACQSVLGTCYRLRANPESQQVW